MTMKPTGEIWIWAVALLKQAEVCARFPVDTSMNVEIVENRKALTTVRNKKKELKDLDNHAYQAGSETSSNVVDALDSVDELETDLDQSKESMKIKLLVKKNY